MASETYLLKCPVCGAPWHPSPEDIVYTCESCGYTVDLRTREQVEEHGMLKSVDVNVIKQAFRKFLDDNKGVIFSLPREAQIVELSPIYIPFWLINFKANSRYHGYKEVQVPVERTVQRRDANGRLRTETVTEYRRAYEPVDGEIRESGIQPVLARHHSSLYGYKYFVKKIAIKKPEPFNIKEAKRHNAIILNSELDRKTAIKFAKNIIYDRHRKVAEGKCTELFDIRTRIEILGENYVHAPYWLVRYQFRRKRYTVAVNGIDGKVLVGKIPLTLMRRVANLIFAILGMLIGMFSYQIGMYFLYAGEVIADAVFIFLAVIGLLIINCTLSTCFSTELEKSG